MWGFLLFLFPLFTSLLMRFPFSSDSIHFEQAFEYCGNTYSVSNLQLKAAGDSGFGHMIESPAESYTEERAYPGETHILKL